MYLCSWGLKSLEKITSFFGLLHLWNIFGRDKANEIMKKVKYWGKHWKKIKMTNFLDKSCLSNHTLTTVGEKKQVTIPQFLLRGEELGSFFSNFQTKHEKSFTFLALGSGICEIFTMRFAKMFWAKILKEKLCWEDLTRLIQKVPSGNLLSWRPKSFEPRKLLIDISRRQPGSSGKS